LADNLFNDNVVIMTSTYGKLSFLYKSESSLIVICIFLLSKIKNIFIKSKIKNEKKNIKYFFLKNLFPMIISLPQLFIFIIS